MTSGPLSEHSRKHCQHKTCDEQPLHGYQGQKQQTLKHGFTLTWETGTCHTLLIKAAAAALFFALVATQAFAQGFCAPRDLFVQKLADDFSESPVAHGLTNANDRLLELFASKDGKTWTLIITYPNGQSCVITAGHSWRETMPELLKPTGQPT